MIITKVNEANTKEMSIPYRDAIREIDSINRKIKDDRITINLANPISSDIFELSINWAGVGSVTPDEAKKFAVNLTRATELVDKCKYLGYLITY